MPETTVDLMALPSVDLNTYFQGLKNKPINWFVVSTVSQVYEF